MKFKYTFLLAAISLSTISAQEHLNVRGDARIQKDLTVESLAGPSDRNVVADQFGVLKVEATKTKTYSVSPTTWLPFDTTSNYDRRSFSFLPYTSLPNPFSTSDDAYVAPLNMPDDIVIDSIRVYYVDASDDNGIIVQFIQYDVVTNNEFQINVLSSLGSPSPGQNQSVSDLKIMGAYPIDNSKYTYSLLMVAKGQWEPALLDMRSIFIHYRE